MCNGRIYASFQGVFARLQRHGKNPTTMVPQPTNQRSSPRSLLLCPVSISFQDGTAHGILRDISAGGIFFYSNIHPPLHASIDFIVHLNDKKISGTGKVVRVEQSAPGAAIGIALQISAESVVSETVSR